MCVGGLSFDFPAIFFLLHDTYCYHVHIYRTGGPSHRRPWWYLFVLLMCAPLLLIVFSTLTVPAIVMLAMLIISMKVRTTMVSG